MQGANRFRSAFAILVLLVALTCGSGSASAATGGVVPVPSSGGSSGGTTPGTTATHGPTGGISPSTVRPADKPVKPKKKKRKRRRRHPVHTQAPAPAPSNMADIPASYLKLYKAAGARYGVDWRIL